MALGLLTVLTIAGTAVTYYATSNLTASTTNKARTTAFDLAEAGVNDAMAVLYNQLNTDGSIKSGGTSPLTTTLLPSTTIQYAGLHGSVTYSGHAQHDDDGVDDHVDRQDQERAGLPGAHAEADCDGARA